MSAPDVVAVLTFSEIVQSSVVDRVSNAVSDEIDPSHIIVQIKSTGWQA